ncbi:hypothetical protein HYW20_02645 [Candidatus Woesearchaeota archaeon]|nr:hypothetical protein [Candidatus Woesearchaeota archaeon]
MDDKITIEKNFSQLLGQYCREIPEKDNIERAIPKPKDKKPKSIDDFASHPSYPTALDLEILILASTIGVPDEGLLGKYMLDQLKEVHYNKHGRLVIPKGLTKARMRERIWNALDRYSNNVVYGIFKDEIRHKGENKASYKLITSKYQRIKDRFRKLVADDIMYLLSLGQIGRENLFVTEEGLSSLRQFLGNAVRRNLYVLVNHKYREEIRTNHDNGKRKRANSYWKDERTIPTIPRRFGHPTLGGMCYWINFGENFDCGGYFVLEYGDVGHNLQEAYFRRDANRFLNASKYQKYQDKKRK